MEGRLGIVLVGELGLFGGIFPAEFGQQRQAKINACGHAAARGPVPVDDDAVPRRGDVHGFEHRIVSPVRRGLESIQQPGSAEHGRTRANRGHMVTGRSTASQKREDLLVLHEVVAARTTANEQDIQVLGAVGKGRRGHDGKAGVGRDRFKCFPQQMIGAVRSQHGQRSDNVESSHLWIDHNPQDEWRRGIGGVLHVIGEGANTSTVGKHSRCFGGFDAVGAKKLFGGAVDDGERTIAASSKCGVAFFGDDVGNDP